MYPVLFEIGSIFVSSLWVFVCTGLLVSGIVLIQLTQKKNMKMAFLVHSFLPMLFWGGIGGRIGYVLTNIQQIFSDPIKYSPIRIINILDLGFEFWGVVLGIVIYMYFTCKKEEESMSRWFDIITIAILSGIPFGHIGAFLEGLNFGKETDLPWGITFESYTVPYTVPIHPTQFYALAYSIMIFVALGYIFIKKPLKHDGDIALIAAFSYAAMRFIEEFFRGDESVTIFGVNLAYYVTFFVIVSTGISLLIRYNKLNFIRKNAL